MSKPCPQCGYDPEVNTLSDVSFIYGERQVYRFGVGVTLTKREMDIFEILYDAGHKGATHEEVCRELYNLLPDCDVPEDHGMGSFNVHICRMRKKLRRLGLLIASDGRGWHAGKFKLIKMRAINKEHALATVGRTPGALQ